MNQVLDNLTVLFVLICATVVFIAIQIQICCMLLFSLKLCAASDSRRELELKRFLATETAANKRSWTNEAQTTVTDHAQFTHTHKHDHDYRTGAVLTASGSCTQHRHQHNTTQREQHAHTFTPSVWSLAQLAIWLGAWTRLAFVLRLILSCSGCC